MEETKINTTEKYIQLIYILNKGTKNEGDMKLIRIKSNENNKIISYEEIIYSFKNFLKQNKSNSKMEEEFEEFSEEELDNIKFEYIRYNNGKNWILLQKNKFIFINEKSNLDNLKIMIKANISKIGNKYINNQFSNIDKEIDNIKTELNNIKNNNPETPFNIIVLTANPLIYEKNKEIIELRTMNDFNIIPANLYYFFNEEEYLKYVDFQPLTIKAFKDAIINNDKRPDILHLICKSTYVVPDEKKKELENEKEEKQKRKEEIKKRKEEKQKENFLKEEGIIKENSPKITKKTKKTKKPKLDIDSSDYVNLIFEKDNCDADFIDKKRIKEIFFGEEEEKEKMREGVKNMTLIISTQLAEDVYNMFQFEGFKFKNILVQHTTLANIDFVTKFNLLFYKELMLFQLSKFHEVYNDALNINFDKNSNSFCCCFHKHKSCDFMINLINELYNKNNDKCGLNKLKQIIPHFCHLYPKCLKENLNICPNDDDFCIHIDSCRKKYKSEFQPKTKVVCCCRDIKKHKIHNLYNIFFKNPDDRSFNNNNRKKKLKIYLKDNYIPKFEKMELLVGKNKIVFESIQFLNSDDKYYYNIYGDNIEHLKIFGNIITEYYKERYHLYRTNKKIRKEFKSIDLNNDNLYNFQDELRNNTIYFVYNYIKDNNKLAEFINNIEIKSSKILFFSQNQILNKKIYASQEITSDPLIRAVEEYKSLNEFIPNEYIKYQNDYIVRNIWLEKE